MIPEFWSVVAHSHSDRLRIRLSTLRECLIILGGEESETSVHSPSCLWFWYLGWIYRAQPCVRILAETSTVLRCWANNLNAIPHFSYGATCIIHFFTLQYWTEKTLLNIICEWQPASPSQNYYCFRHTTLTNRVHNHCLETDRGDATRAYYNASHLLLWLVQHTKLFPEWYFQVQSTVTYMSGPILACGKCFCHH